MLDSMKMTVLAESLRAHWQMGTMDDWFCMDCGRSHGCDTSVEILACDDDGLPLRGVRSVVRCGDCFDKDLGDLLKRTADLPDGVNCFALDGRVIDWGCPGMSPPEAFQPVSALAVDDGPRRCDATVDMFTGEVGA